MKSNVKSVSTPEDKPKKEYSAPALDKGLDVLELLSAEPEGLSMSEICKRLDRSTSELFRMLVVLERRGYVSQIDGTERYNLTLRLFELAHRYPPVKRLTSVAGSIMRRLTYEIEQSCHLVIYYEGKGHVVVQQDAPSARNFSVRLGAEVPLATTCSGRLLLAFADDIQRRDMISNIPSGHPTLTLKKVKEFADQIKSQGYEIMDSGQALGVRDIGYPIFDYSGLIIATLVVPFVAYIDNSHPIPFKDSQNKLEAAAAEINRSIGASVK